MKKTTVWSYGGGTQSAAIAVLILQGKLPKPDLIAFADTSREVTETWMYLANVVRPALLAAGMEVYVLRHEYSKHDLYKSDKLLLPAFTTQSGKKGKLPTYCSNEWKQRVVRRWMREQSVIACDLWLGISMDEIERMKPADRKWVNHVYPLIQTVPMRRHECITTVMNYGWPKPPKSRCWMCPNMSPQSWVEMRDNWPEDFAKAVEMDGEIRKRDPDVFLHASAIPLLEAVAQTDTQPGLFDGCDGGYCFT